MIAFETVRFPAADGYELTGRIAGAGQRGPVVLINGATGVGQSYYSKFSDWAAEQGATVVTYDYRGIGQSRPTRMRGFPATLHDWRRYDFEGLLRWARAEYSRRPLVALGHSVGGQLLGQAASNSILSKAVTIGGQFGSWQLWPAPRKWLMASLWYAVVPGVSYTLGYLPGALGVGADLPKGVALEWARWNRSRNYFLEHGITRDGYERLKIPIFAYSFSDDSYAPSAAVDALHSLYSSARLERRHVLPADVGAQRVGHFGFFRDTFRNSLWQQLGEFVFQATL